jgi:type I restriction enzyme S subunit
LGSLLSKGRLGGNYANQDAEAELPLMKMGNLARGFFDLSKVQFITPSVQPESVHRLIYGDVLFNTRNTLDSNGYKPITGVTKVPGFRNSGDAAQAPCC